MSLIFWYLSWLTRYSRFSETLNSTSISRTMIEKIWTFRQCPNPKDEFLLYQDPEQCFLQVVIASFGIILWLEVIKQKSAQLKPAFAWTLRNLELTTFWNHSVVCKSDGDDWWRRMRIVQLFSTQPKFVKIKVNFQNDHKPLLIR